MARDPGSTAFMAAQASTAAQGIMATQASGAAPWLADRPTMDAAQLVTDSAVATHVAAQHGVAFAAAATGRSHPLTPSSTAGSSHCRPFPLSCQPVCRDEHGSRRRRNPGRPETLPWRADRSRLFEAVPHAASGARRPSECAKCLGVRRLDAALQFRDSYRPASQARPLRKPAAQHEPPREGGGKPPCSFQIHTHQRARPGRFASQQPSINLRRKAAA